MAQRLAKTAQRLLRHPAPRRKLLAAAPQRRRRRTSAAKLTKTTRQLSILDSSPHHPLRLLLLKPTGPQDGYIRTLKATDTTHLTATTATCVVMTTTESARRPTPSMTEVRHSNPSSLRSTLQGHHFAVTLHRGPQEKSLMTVTLLRQPSGATTVTTTPTYRNLGQTMRTKATQHRLTLQNEHKHNNTPTTYKDNTFHKTTTTMRQALHHRPTTNHQRHLHRHSHHYRFQLNLTRTTSENHRAATFSTYLPLVIESGYMGSKANQNSMVWKAPL